MKMKPNGKFRLGRQMIAPMLLFFGFVGLGCLSLAASDTGPRPLKEFRQIIIADSPSSVQKTAADELQHYVEEITGTKLVIVSLGHWDPHSAGLSFFLGDEVATKVLGSSPAPWHSEEYLLQSTSQGLVLAGQDGPGDPWSTATRAGTMLAVYTLLDDFLGVHWFWPGEFGEHVPHSPDAAIPPLQIRRTPAFEIRSIELGYTTYHTPAFHEAGRKWARRTRQGWVKSAVFGHSWDDAFAMRRGETFQEHPEWFALVNGKRRPPQMCTTNPEVIDHMVEYVLKGKSAIMNISPSDGGGFCQCPQCQALDVPGVLGYDNKQIALSDRIFTYANEVARRVREANPEKGCGMFAYTLYNRPPVHIKHLEPNLYLAFVYQSAAMRNPANLQEWRASVSGWKSLGAKMVVREGWGNHYYFDLPFLHYHQILTNLAEASQLGFVAAYGEGTKNFATTAPNYWAITRMMWDPARDTSKVMDEYFTSAYGPAAGEMQEYFETYNRALDANWSKMPRNVDTTAIAYENMIAAWHTLLPPSTVDEAERHLQAAARLAPSGEYADRVRFHQFGQDYTRLMLQLLEGYRQLAILGMKLDTFPAAEKTRREAPEERAALLQQVYEWGEGREKFLLAHRDWAGPDEGLLAYTNDAQLRRWHKQVKHELGIETPSVLVKENLVPSKPAIR